jgi:hypothetical protein
MTVASVMQPFGVRQLDQESRFPDGLIRYFPPVECLL